MDTSEGAYLIVDNATVHSGIDSWLQYESSAEIRKYT